MKRVCSWCSKELPPREDYAADGAITHGICSLCAIKATGHKPRSAKTILNLIQEAVFIVDSNGIIKATNRSGERMLCKKSGDIEDHLGGAAFECSYSRADGGCGRTIHCKTCTIRNIVMDTLSTGKGYQHVPAFQSIETGKGTKLLKFLVSTEKVKDRIFLRIDEVTDVTVRHLQDVNRKEL